jgi:hypothetical protein
MNPNMQQNYDIPLHDIKPLVEIHEYSFYYTLGLLFIALLFLLALIYFGYRWFINRKRFNLRKENYKALQEIDMNDTKNAAYKITSYGYTFKNDSPRHSEMYENLINRLENYKYKKDVESFDDEVKGYIDLYKGMIDV